MRRLVPSLKFFVLCLILGPLLVLAVQNSQPVSLTMHPLPYEARLPLFFFAVLVFLGGVACCGIVLSVQQLGIRREAARLKRRNEALENELAGIKHEARYKTALTPTVPAP